MIIQDRLKMMAEKFPQYKEEFGTGVPVMQAAAIEFCAKKTAVAGDLRKAMDLCRQSIELAEQDWKIKNLKLPEDEREFPLVTVQHMLKVVNSVYGAANPSVAKIRNLNPQQKLVLALAYLMESQKMERTVQQLYDAYVVACRKDALLSAVTRAEFFDLIQGMESTGLISVSHTKMAVGAGSSKLGMNGSPANMLPVISLSTSAPGTPHAETPHKRGKIAGGFAVQTPSPRLLKIQKTPVSSIKKGQNTPSRLDTSAHLMVLANRQELTMGLNDLPFLNEFLERGVVPTNAE